MLPYSRHSVTRATRSPGRSLNTISGRRVRLDPAAGEQARAHVVVRVLSGIRPGDQFRLPEVVRRP